MTKHKIDLGLTAYDELFGQIPEDGFLEIPIKMIDSFAGHTYKVKDDEEMDQLVESIRENGVLMPAILREKPNGRYECISGHRRKRACEILELKTIPAKVVEMDDDAAVIAMVDSNLHREHILPSEKAFSLKVKIEALNRQGKRNDLTFSQLGKKLNSYELVAEESGESRNQIHRYIRLTNLIPALLDMVDEGRIKINPAVEISYLNEEQQSRLLDVIEREQVIPSLVQAKQVKAAAAEGDLTEDKILEILIGKQKKPTSSGKDAYKRICKIVPETVPADKTEDFIMTAIRYYLQHSNADESEI